MHIAVSLVLLVLLLPFHRASAVERLVIDAERDPDYLPYKVEIMENIPFSPTSMVIGHWKCVAKTGTGPSDPGLFVRVSNPPVTTDVSAQFNVREFPQTQSLRADFAIQMVISSFEATYDAEIDDILVVGGGNQSDSAFAFMLNESGSIRNKVFLASGTDRTGDGSWSGMVMLMLSADYDHDGTIEYFFWTNPQRDLTPRLLFCVDLESSRVEWSLPVASVVLRVLSLPYDAIEPGLLVVTAGPANGVQDDVFDDQYGYLTRIDTAGHIVWNHITSVFPRKADLWKGPTDDTFYLLHTRMFGTQNDDAVTCDTSLISIVDTDGEPVRTITCPSRVAAIWSADYDDDDTLEVFAISVLGAISIYDRQLNLIAQSNDVGIANIACILPSLGGEGPVFAMVRQSEVELYSKSFEKLAAVPIADHILPIEFDASGDVSGFVGFNQQTSIAGRITKRKWYDYIAIAYLDYQTYVLTALFAAFVGLVLISYYGRKTRRNLAIIRTQKIELEQAHRELREAQARIIEQEKFQQAKNIAGGFAHKIRNALFPARGIISNVQRQVGRGELKAHLKDADESLVLAIEMTSNISLYANLDSAFLPETVAVAATVGHVLDSRGGRIDRMQVAVHLEGSEDISVVINGKQFEMVLDNLIGNSLDAMKRTPEPSLTFSWHSEGDFVVVRCIDNGEGISPKDAARVFDMFFTTRPDSGTGIGLALAKKIVEMYEGAIVFSNGPGGGAVFELRLPQDKVTSMISTQSGR